MPQIWLYIFRSRRYTRQQQKIYAAELLPEKWKPMPAINVRQAGATQRTVEGSVSPFLSFDFEFNLQHGILLCMYVRQLKPSQAATRPSLSRKPPVFPLFPFSF